MTVIDEVRHYWNEDAAVYDQAPDHHPTDPALLAAWTEAVASLLPPPPARVLDCGAGTGFLSLIAARLGHQVTAIDISPAMLQRLKEKAAAADVAVEVVEGSADQPLSGGRAAEPFDAVMERHLLWTLPQPVTALREWRRLAPDGRLVLFEGAWATADPLSGVRRRARWLAQRLEATAAPGGSHPAPRHGGHHAEYPESIRRTLPLGSGTTPGQLVAATVEAGWPAVRLRRLRDIEWATTLDRSLIERLVGASPRYAVVAGR
ncbi:MAG TPA: methyltransferase domain-containing protein [Acidimicrobiales bacterium]|nr:methyltransferase domain-containing protein [Acidimicrobiales bacterium]